MVSEWNRRRPGCSCGFWRDRGRILDTKKHLGEVEMSATASGPPRLMGRAAELEILSGLLDRVAGRGGALVVRGEPGIGNTTLLEFWPMARQRV